MATFDTVLRQRLSRDPGQPLVTFYDHDSGERTELSVTTYANWVAKTASLLCDEHGLEHGDRLRIDLPTHWLAPVFLGAAWSAGLVVTDSDDAVDAVVCGPTGLGRWEHAAGSVPVLACSLQPLGVRFAEPLPAGVHDVGVEVWSHPDAFTPAEAPTEHSAAVETAGLLLTHGGLWESAAAGTILADGGRLLTQANPASPPGLACFAEPLVRGGSVVLVVRAGADQLEATYATERATARFPA